MCTFKRSFPKISIFNLADCYKPNAHYFANCGPSIVSSCLRKKRPIQPTVSTEINTLSMPNESEIKAPPVKEEPKQQVIEKPIKPSLRLSKPKTLIEKPENTVKFANQIPPPPTTKQLQNQGKLRNLSPATLSQMLSAELDHFLKVEQDIAQVAEVETNVEAARHEHMISNQIQLEDDSAEIEELERLDAEIARLEAIYEEKLNNNSYYSMYSYSEIE